MFSKGVREEQREVGTAWPSDLSSKTTQDSLLCLETESSIRGENFQEKLLTRWLLSQSRIATHCIYKIPYSPRTLSSWVNQEATRLACWWLTYKGVFFGKLNGWLHCLHWDSVCGPFCFLQHREFIHFQAGHNPALSYSTFSDLSRWPHIAIIRSDISLLQYHVHLSCLWLYTYLHRYMHVYLHVYINPFSCVYGVSTCVGLSYSDVTLHYLCLAYI